MDKYHQTLQKRGQPLHEGVTIVREFQIGSLRTPHPLPLHGHALHDHPSCLFCARFPEVLVHRLTLRRSLQLRMHVLAFLKC